MILFDIQGHMVSDESLAELHDFAQKKMNLKREWFQDKKIPHYDLTTAQARWRAKMSGAREVDSRDIVSRAVRT